MQKLAFVLIGIGILVIIGYFARDFFTASSIPLPFRVATGVVGLGLILLLASTIKDRLEAAKKEHFEEVEK